MALADELAAGFSAFNRATSGVIQQGQRRRQDEEDRKRKDEDRVERFTVIEALRERQTGRASPFLTKIRAGESDFPGASSIIAQLDAVPELTIEDAEALAATVAPPSDTFQAQMERLRQERFVGTELGSETTRAILGKQDFIGPLPEPQQQVDALQTVLGARRAGAGAVSTLTDPAGVVSRADPLLGTVEPFGQIAPDRLSLTEMLAQGGFDLDIDPEKGISLSAGARRGGALKAEQRERARLTFEQTREGGLIIDELGKRVIENPEIIRGKVGEIGAGLRSALIQVGQLAEVHGIEGASNLEDLIDKGSSGALRGSSLEHASVTPLQFQLAVANALAASGGTEVSRTELERSLQSIAGTKSGDPEQILATLRSLTRISVNRANLRTEDFSDEFKRLRVEDIAPSLFGGQRRAPVLGEEVTGPTVDVGVEVEAGEGILVVEGMEDLEAHVERLRREKAIRDAR